MIPISGYGGRYFACKSGKIWATKSKKLPNGGYLKSWTINKGYQVVMLYGDGGSKKYLVHRLIATAYKENPDKLKEVNHIDCSYSNNIPSNLEWVTSAQNKQHAIKNGRYKNLGKNTPRGSKFPSSKLTEKQVIEIRRKVKAGAGKRTVAREYGVSDTLVRFIVQRRTWKHI